jgi:dihydrolipoamide dehydrogenase
MTKHYDLIVIGSGAGSKLARPAAQKGLKAAIIEKDKLGGTCLNRGCIPSKLLIHPADVALEIKEAKKFDIKVDTKFQVNFKKLMTRINTTTDSDSNKIKTWYESKKVPGLDYYHGTAKFVEDKVIEINGELLSADKIVIGVGARPFIPPIKGLSETPFWTSTEALRARELPKRLIVIGGGYIGVELGHAFSALGSNTEFIVRERGCLALVDKDAREEFERVFESRNTIHVSTDTNEVSFDSKKKEFTVTFDDHISKKNKKIKADQVLVATGVKPNNDLLGLETTTINLNKRGFIEVNEHMETSCPGVYALGDCVGHYMFRHSANFEAEYLYDKLIDSKHEKIEYPPMPWAVFTNPQVAGVGLTQDDLENMGKVEGEDFIVGKHDYKNSAMGEALQSEVGFVKLIFDKNGYFLGSTIIGAEASNMIHMAVILLTMHAKIEDFFKFVYIHPALPEVFRNAARTARSKLEK